MQPTDLNIPIYLNQQVVFDLLAVLDDGFTTLSNVKTSTGESETNKYGAGASIGASNVFALLGISFSGDRGREKVSQDQTQTSQEKVHTPTSLFAKLRLKLQELELIRRVETDESLKELQSGEFVEFRAVLRKNPLVETIEGFKQLMDIAQLFLGATPADGQPKQKTKQSQNVNNLVIKQIDGMLNALNQSNSVELIGELLDNPGVKSVLTARPEFFSLGGLAEIVDGEFRVLGKIIRVVKSEADEPINLLRKTSFGRFDRKIFDQLQQALGSVEAAGLRSTDLITEINGPAMLVIPIAIFS